MAIATLTRRSPSIFPHAFSRTFSIRHASTSPSIIKPSRQEVNSGSLTDRNLEYAIRALHEDGLVIIEDAISHSDLDSLNQKMVSDALILQSRGKAMPFNYNVGNIQQSPPPLKGLFPPSIFLNPFATQISSTHLGPLPKWTFCSANSALPPTPQAPVPQRQPVHSDADFAHPEHPFALVVNVPMITFTPENGSTELWLGTHKGGLSGLRVQVGEHGKRASGRIREEVLEGRRKVRGPCQPVVKKGSIVIRDLRLWHAGMGNRSGEVRVMVALIHFAPWYRNGMRLEMGEGLREVIGKEKGLEIPVDWVDDGEVGKTYLDRSFGNSFDFSQAP